MKKGASLKQARSSFYSFDATKISTLSRHGQVSQNNYSHSI